MCWRIPLLEWVGFKTFEFDLHGVGPQERAPHQEESIMKTAAIVSCFGLFAAVASADTVEMQFGGVLQGHNVSIRVNEGRQYNVFAGSILHNIDGERTVTYCIDPDQWASTGTNTFERTILTDALSSRPYGEEKAHAVAELAHFAGEDIWSEHASRDLASAFQLAVWEVILDFDPNDGTDSLNLNRGAFRASGKGNSHMPGAISNLVDQMFGSLQFGQSNPHQFAAFTNERYQDFMTQVPAPGAAALALMGLPLLATRKR
ncbi:MAG: hypothetical protein D6695_03020 [Planctomycetota bacterium]|nr:MAG: hypothetical protein D6695_03020 [Planctomycetota bacterium]